MDSTQATRLITAAGGDIAFAKLLGLDLTKKGVAQLVNNWKRRGLPSKIVVEHYEALKELERKAARQPCEAGNGDRGASHGR